MLGTMEAKVLEDLEQKLGDLDHKVQAYRHDMIAGFQRYYHQTLQDIAPSVAHNVGQTLNSTLLAKYPAIAPDVRQQLALDPEKDVSLSASGCGQQQQGVDSHFQPSQRAESDKHAIPRPDTNTNTLAAKSTAASPGLSLSPPYVAAAVFGAAVDSPGSPHERELEFQGLFTPSYLPLLDSSPNLPPLLPTAASPSLPVQGSAGSGIGIGIRIGSSTGTGSAIGVGVADLQGLQDMEGSSHRRETGATATTQPDQQGASQAALPRRPKHERRSTNDTSCSDTSDTKVRRSALRRSSSSSKPPYSPRRVRFELRGAEVLPTASPQSTDYPTPRPSSPESSESSEKLRSSAEILGDEDEPKLPPRKISSSEALRALSKQPIEGTVWTVVNPSADESALEKSSARSPSLSPKGSSGNMASPVAPAPPISVQPLPEPLQLESLRETREENLEDSSSSDDDFLSMAKPKSSNSKTSGPSAIALSASHQGAQSRQVQQPASTDSSFTHQEVRTAIKDAEEDKDQASSEDYDAEEEEMFQFEGGGLTPPPRPKPRPRAGQTNIDSPPASPVQDVEDAKLSYGTSPAVPIAGPAVSSGPPTPTTSRFQVGSLGSYKGRPVIMPVVKNPELHEQAASLGQFNTFVGGLDGRSGMDEGDLNSFRASLIHNDFSGTPRSLTERMMMEDARMAKTSRDQTSG